MTPLLEAEALTKRYRMGDADLEVLKGVNVRVDRGEVVAVVGPSGVGKSTLLHILGGLDTPTSGALRVDGTDVFGLSEDARAAFRNRYVGFVFQFHHLLGDFTAAENVMMPLLIQGRDRRFAAQEAEALLCRVGLSRRAGHLPSELSGGESQRVAVARALVARPALVLADEPSGNLDLARSADLHDMIWRLARELKQTFVIATHDPTLAGRADRILEMADGRILAG